MKLGACHQMLGLAALARVSSAGQLQMSNEVSLSWTVGESDIVFRAESTSCGWLAIGFGEATSGSMRGADMAVLEFDDAGMNATLTDSYALEFARPVADTCQDYTLLGASQDTSSGFTTFEFSRPLNTGDAQDRTIGHSLIPLMYAHGNDCRNSMSYHGSSRGVVFAEVLSAPEKILQAEPTDVEVLMTREYRMGNVELTADRTQYYCKAVELPVVEGADSHIIEVDNIMDASNGTQHHMLIHLCNDVPGGFVERFSENAGDCGGGAIGDPSAGCSSLLYSWALGIGKVEMPPQAGFRIGVDYPAMRYAVIEIHYDNPEGLTGVVDDSGFSMVYTPSLREYDASSIIIGDPLVTFGSRANIPAATDQVHYEGVCPSECTQKMSHEIHVFSDFLHMHEIGDAMWTTLYRDGENMGYTNRVEFYDFGFQQSTSVDYVLKPGDQLHTHCMYNSRSRSNETLFGGASNDEMCMNFLTYYPALELENINGEGTPFQYCGSHVSVFDFLGTQGEHTACGSNSMIIEENYFQNYFTEGSLYMDLAPAVTDPDPHFEEALNQQFGQPCV
jgi:hypothetical protein